MWLTSTSVDFKYKILLQLMLVGLGQSVEGLKNKNGGFEVKDRLCLKAEALTFV